jgi:hypothetical protein
MIGSLYLLPFPAQDMPLSVFNLIEIGHTLQRVLPTFNGSRLNHPRLSVLRLHHQILVTMRAVLTLQAKYHMEAFSPLRGILYFKSQFHIIDALDCKDTNFLSKVTLFQQKSCTFVPNFFQNAGI